MCSYCRKRDVTGELSFFFFFFFFFYIGVGIKGGSRGGHGPPLSSYHSVSKLIQLL